jgi:hypothetical protein
MTCLETPPRAVSVAACPESSSHADGWGDINHGQAWYPHAPDLWRALLAARLGDYEQLLVNALMDRTWGATALGKKRGGAWPEPVPLRATINVLAAEIAPRNEAIRKYLYRAGKTLRDSGMIRVRDGGMLIETDVLRWLDRIPEAIRPYVLAGRSGSESRPASSPSNETSLAGEAESSSLSLEASPPGEAHQSLRRGASVPQEGLVSLSCEAPPIDEAPARFRFQKIEEEQYKPTIPESVGSLNSQEPEAQTPSPPAAPPPPPTPAPVRNPRPLAELMADEPFIAIDAALDPVEPELPTATPEDRFRKWVHDEIAARTGDDSMADQGYEAAKCWFRTGRPAKKLYAHFLNYTIGLYLKGEVTPGRLIAYVEGCLRRYRPDTVEFVVPDGFPAEFRQSAAPPGGYYVPAAEPVPAPAPAASPRPSFTGPPPPVDEQSLRQAGSFLTPDLMADILAFRAERERREQRAQQARRPLASMGA